MREANECLGIFVCLCLSVLVQSGWGRQHMCARVCVINLRVSSFVSICACVKW